MLAWELFKKSVLLIADNLGAALRVTLVPYAILAAASLYYADQADITWMMQVEPGTVPEVPPGFASALFVSLIIQVFVYLWIAVGWHRYVLLGEGGESWLPVLKGGEMLGYLGRTLLLGLILLGVSLLVTLVLAFVLPFLAAPVMLLLGFIIFYRLGLILPAGAIGQPITISEAWEKTKGHSGTVVFLALLTVLVSILLQIPAMATGGAGGPVDPADLESAADQFQPSLIGTLYNLVVGWIVLMIGVGVLSTLYGHFVEGRRLD